MLATNNQIVATQAGNSDHLSLPQGEHLLVVNAATWGQSFLQVGDGVNFADAKDDDGNKIELTEDEAVIVRGGVSYRLRTVSYVAQITVSASKA